jgi:hypothetical protein
MRSTRCSFFLHAPWYCLPTPSYVFPPLRRIFTIPSGWADTPGVATAMPGFRAKFAASLRSSEQGADTVIWLATKSDDRALESGAFYFDRSIARKHLPLAGTQVFINSQTQLLCSSTQTIRCGDCSTHFRWTLLLLTKCSNALGALAKVLWGRSCLGLLRTAVCAIEVKFYSSMVEYNHL